MNRKLTLWSRLMYVGITLTLLSISSLASFSVKIDASTESSEKRDGQSRPSINARAQSASLSFVSDRKSSVDLSFLSLKVPSSLRHHEYEALPVGDFSVSASPSSRTIIQGQTTTYTITVTSVNGFSGSVALKPFTLVTVIV